MNGYETPEAALEAAGITGVRLVPATIGASSNVPVEVTVMETKQVCIRVPEEWLERLKRNTGETTNSAAIRAALGAFLGDDDPVQHGGWQGNEKSKENLTSYKKDE